MPVVRGVQVSDPCLFKGQIPRKPIIGSLAAALFILKVLFAHSNE